MSIALWTAFFFASPPSVAANNTCAARGTPLLEMRAGTDNVKSSTSTKVFATGAWTIERNGRRIDRGCFDRKELRAIRRAVQRAPWTETSSPIACFAYDPNFTQYLVHGELRFTERMCSGKAADSTTLRAIELVKAELAEDRAPEPTPPPPPPVIEPVPPPPVKPPPGKPQACRATGTPMFEINQKAEMPMPTSSIAIYSTGAWTYTATDKDGHLATSAAGCFDASTLRSLRQVIQISPWDTTVSGFTCKAYSPTFTDYVVNGQREYTARLCGAEKLDEKSLGAIEIIEAELAKVLPAR